VPNYVLAKSNCVAQTDIYAYCCMNECEGLYRQLEERIVAPDGTHEQIVPIVAGLSSSTVHAPRNLSQTLLRRLEEIAQGSGGKLLLHGRLFAQWMHQAFPRECPYPHLAGTTTSLSPYAWEAQTGQAGSIGRRLDLAAHISALERSLGQPEPDAESAMENGTADSMWTCEEEYLVNATLAPVGLATRALRVLPQIVLVIIFICAALAAKYMSVSGGSGHTKLVSYLV